MMNSPNINFADGANNSNAAAQELANGVIRGSKSKNKKGKAVSKELLRNVIDRAVKTNVDLTDGYENYLNVGMAIANTFGEEGRELFQKACRQWNGYDPTDVNAKYDNILATSNGDITGSTLLMIAKAHGIDISTKEDNAANQAIEYLTARWIFRFNVRNGRVEFAVKSDDDDKKWKVMTDKDFCTIFTELRKAGIRINRGDLEAIINADSLSPSFDILEDYFKSLPDYIPGDEDAIDAVFFHLILDDAEDAELCRMMFRKWFINMVARWMYQDTDTQAILALIGAQFTGKTYFFKNILPPTLRQYLDVVLPNENFHDKDRKLTLSEKFLLLFDEWSIGRKMANVIKSVTTLSQTALRDSYRRFRENRQCISAFALTSNEEKPLSTLDGNRRYCMIHIKGTQDLNVHPLDLDAAYAEAVHIIESGEKYHFDREDVVRISEHNGQFTEELPCEDGILKYYRIPTDEETGVAVGSADIIEKIRCAVPPAELNATNIGKAMSHLGFRCTHPKGVARYYVFELDGQRINDNKTDDGKAMKELFAKESGMATAIDTADDVIPTDSEIDEPF